MICWKGLCHLATSKSYPKNEMSWRKYLQNLAIGKHVVHFLRSWSGKAKPIVCGATPGMMILDFIIKQVE